MANNESLSDKAVSLVALIGELESLLQGTNDWGDSTGYCSELSQIQNDASEQIGMLRSRVYNLKRRFILAERSHAKG
jgi:hypothetical protein